MKKKYLLITAVILTAVGTMAYTLFLKKPFEYAGTIEATRIDLPARIATVVKTIPVEEGQIVNKDQLVAELACEEITITYNLANKTFERAKRLKQIGSISKEAFDQIQSKRQELATKLSWCEIKSPVAGTILTKYLEPSEWVNPGSKLVSIADLRTLWTYFYVSQELMSTLKLGTEISATVPEIEKNFTGVIIKISDEAEFTPKNVQTQSERTRLVFGVKVAFKNDKTLLKPGMTIVSSLNAK